MPAALNLDELIDKAASATPWDFVVKIGGVEYATRRPSDHDLDQLRQLDKLAGDDGFELMRGFFVGSSPALEQLSSQQLSGFLAGYIAHYRKVMSAQTAKVAKGAAAAASATTEI